MISWIVLNRLYQPWYLWMSTFNPAITDLLGNPVGAMVTGYAQPITKARGHFPLVHALPVSRGGPAIKLTQMRLIAQKILSC